MLWIYRNLFSFCQFWFLTPVDVRFIFFPAARSRMNAFPRSSPFGNISLTVVCNFVIFSPAILRKSRSHRFFFRATVTSLRYFFRIRRISSCGIFLWIEHSQRIKKVVGIFRGLSNISSPWFAKWRSLCRYRRIAVPIWIRWRSAVTFALPRRPTFPVRPERWNASAAAFPRAFEAPPVLTNARTASSIMVSVGPWWVHKPNTIETIDVFFFKKVVVNIEDQSYAKCITLNYHYILME